MHTVRKSTPGAFIARPRGSRPVKEDLAPIPMPAEVLALIGRQLHPQKSAPSPSPTLAEADRRGAGSKSAPKRRGGHRQPGAYVLVARGSRVEECDLGSVAFRVALDESFSGAGTRVFLVQELTTAGADLADRPVKSRTQAPAQRRFTRPTSLARGQTWRDDHPRSQSRKITVLRTARDRLLIQRGGREPEFMDRKIFEERAERGQYVRTS